MLIVKLPRVSTSWWSEELAQSAPEYHADDDTTYDFQENEFKENKNNRKRKTLNLHE